MKAEYFTWDSLRFRLLLLLCCTASTNATNPLSLLFMRSRCDGEGFDSNSVLPAAEIAVERVNNNNSLLPEYSLRLNVTQPTAAGSTDVVGLLEGLLNPPEELAVLYPGCSPDSQVVLDVADSGLFNVTMVTYAFSNLAERSLTFPHHFRLVPSETILRDGIIALIQYYGWTRINLVTQEDPVYVAIGDTLIPPLLESGVAVGISLLRTPVGIAQFLRFALGLEDSRIFVLVMDPNFTRILLCEAQRQNLRSPGYVWITQGWYPEQWWVEGYENCTGDELQSFLEGAIGISHFPTASNESSATDTGITPLEFREEYMARTNQRLVPDYANFVYDAVWATALALNSTTEVNDTAAVRRAFMDLNFTGVSGPVMFGQSRFRSQDRLSISQYRRSQDIPAEGLLVREEVAVIYRTGDGNLNFSYLGSESNTSLWPGGVPQDGSPIVVVNFPLLSLTIICYVYAAAGILVAVCCLVFNFAFRDRKLIRLTSPNLNYILITGAICFYCSAYFFLYPRVPNDTLVIFCNARFWLITIGSSLCYGTIDVKMWRVYLISCQPQLRHYWKKMFLKDWHLMIVVLIFVIVDIIILTTVTAVDNARYTFLSVQDRENPPSVNEEGFEEQYTVLVCFSPSRFVFLSIIYGYKIVIQLIAVILAFSIRKVKIKGLNDSKEISAIIYITSIILVLSIVMTLALRDFINVSGTINAVGFSTAATVALGFLFIPKMVGLYRDPHGEKIFEDPLDRTKSVLGSMETEKTITILKRKVTQLERRLTESQVNLNAHGSAEILDVKRSDTPKEISLNNHGSAVVFDVGSDTPKEISLNNHGSTAAYDVGTPKEEVEVKPEAQDEHVVHTDV